MTVIVTWKCSTGLGLSVSCGRGYRRPETSACRSLCYATDSLNISQRARAVIAQGNANGASHAESSSINSSPTPRWLAVSPTLEQSYLDATAPPMHYHQLGSLIEPAEPCMYGGGYDFATNAYADWEEMTSLLSFDGEEHKYVTRHMPRATLRIEDMFASFDGDDFEAVMTAARGGTSGIDKAVQSTEAVLAAVDASTDAAAAGSAAATAVQRSAALQDTSSLDSSDDPEDLYHAVTRRRAAGLAAEAQHKKNPKPKKRKAPLGTEPSEAWMFQVPVSVAEQFGAAQRALLPPPVQPEHEGKACAAVQRQMEAKAPEVVVVVVQRPVENSGITAPAPHAVHQQAQQTPQAMLYQVSTGGMCRHSDSSRNAAAAAFQVSAGTPGRLSLVHGSTSRSAGGAAQPAAAAPEGLLGLAAVTAATIATQQLQPEVSTRCSTRVLAAPALLAPMPAATAVGAGGLMGLGVTEEAAGLSTRLPALPPPICEDCGQGVVPVRAGGLGVGHTVVGVGVSSVLASSSNTGVTLDDAVVAEGATAKGFAVKSQIGVYDCVAVKRQLGKSALRRALYKLKGCLSHAVGPEHGSSKH